MRFNIGTHYLFFGYHYLYRKSYYLFFCISTAVTCFFHVALKSHSGRGVAAIHYKLLQAPWLFAKVIKAHCTIQNPA